MLILCSFAVGRGGIMNCGGKIMYHYFELRIGRREEKRRPKMWMSLFGRGVVRLQHLLTFLAFSFHFSLFTFHFSILYSNWRWLSLGPIRRDAFSRSSLLSIKHLVLPIFSLVLPFSPFSLSFSAVVRPASKTRGAFPPSGVQYVCCWQGGKRKFTPGKTVCGGSLGKVVLLVT